MTILALLGVVLVEKILNWWESWIDGKPTEVDRDITPGVVNGTHEQRPENVSELKKLQPAVFSGTEKPLDAE